MAVFRVSPLKCSYMKQVSSNLRYKLLWTRKIMFNQVLVKPSGHRTCQAILLGKRLSWYVIWICSIGLYSTDLVDRNWWDHTYVQRLLCSLCMPNMFGGITELFSLLFWGYRTAKMQFWESEPQILQLLRLLDSSLMLPNVWPVTLHSTGFWVNFVHKELLWLLQPAYCYGTWQIFGVHMSSTNVGYSRKGHAMLRFFMTARSW